MRAAISAALASVLAFSGTAFAQDWPTRPVTMIVPYAAGGPVDTVGRIMAAGLSEALGQQVIVENVGGAGGMTGANRVAKGTPDGYTFLLGGQATLTLVPAINGKKTLYDPINDFTHVIQFADSARILIARKDIPVNSLAEFAAYARQNQNRMQFGSAGAGTGMHVCALLLDQAMGTKITHVPYRGSAPALQDLLAGRIDYICDQISTAVPQIKAGNVKAIAIMSPSRAGLLPDLATAQEQGLADIDCGTWSSFAFPKGTPEAIARRLADATNQAMESAFVRERLQAVGVEIMPPERRTREHLAKILPGEVAKQAAAVKAGGLTAD
jgi:tripartite-type tricarboxylate transporter receptor subunit TctC